MNGDNQSVRTTREEYFADRVHERREGEPSMRCSADELRGNAPETFKMIYQIAMDKTET